MCLERPEPFGEYLRADPAEGDQELAEAPRLDQQVANDQERDEAGLEGDYAEDSRRTYPWGQEDEALLAFYGTAIRARRASAALSEGDVETVWLDDATSSYGFARRHGDDTVFALFNPGEEPVEIVLRWPPGLETCIDLLGQLESAVVGERVYVVVPPRSAGWLSPVPNAP